MLGVPHRVCALGLLQIPTSLPQLPDCWFVTDFRVGAGRIYRRYPSRKSKENGFWRQRLKTTDLSKELSDSFPGKISSFQSFLSRIFRRAITGNGGK